MRVVKIVGIVTVFQGFGQAYDVPGLPNDILYVKYAENYLKVSNPFYSFVASNILLCEIQSTT